MWDSRSDAPRGVVMWKYPKRPVMAAAVAVQEGLAEYLTGDDTHTMMDTPDCDIEDTIVDLFLGDERAEEVLLPDGTIVTVLDIEWPFSNGLARTRRCMVTTPGGVITIRSYDHQQWLRLKAGVA